MDRPICPHCGSNRVARVLYGISEIDEELQELIDYEKVLLGGCMILPNSFNYYCINCQNEIYLEEDKK